MLLTLHSYNGRQLKLQIRQISHCVVFDKQCYAGPEAEDKSGSLSTE